MSKKLPLAPVPYFPTAPASPPAGYYPPAPQAPPAQSVEERYGAYCDACGEVIEWGEQCVDIFPGILTRGSKSGQPVVTEPNTPPVSEPVPAIVHWWCIPDYYNHFVEDGGMPGPPERLCAACGSELEDDD